MAWLVVPRRWHGGGCCQWLQRMAREQLKELERGEARGYPSELRRRTLKPSGGYPFPACTVLAPAIDRIQRPCCCNATSERPTCGWDKPLHDMPGVDQRHHGHDPCAAARRGHLLLGQRPRGQPAEPRLVTKGEPAAPKPCGEVTPAQAPGAQELQAAERCTTHALCGAGQRGRGRDPGGQRTSPAPGPAQAREIPEDLVHAQGPQASGLQAVSSAHHEASSQVQFLRSEAGVPVEEQRPL
mmetsp:Transcript_6694/g.21126  ORF Transcript_6694/g.21126 Transcript_6694/m.21126 type:complete len:241 (-) Transcript_6694:518-1240(-)